MPEMRLKSNVGPGNPPHCAWSVQSMGPAFVLDPEAATLPAAAGHNNTLQISLIVLVSVHANLHIALYRERGKLYSWTSSSNNRCQHLYHKRERRGVALNACAE